MKNQKKLTALLKFLESREEVLDVKLPEIASDLSGFFIDAVSTNSQLITKDSLFIAYQGVAKDSHQFIPQAIQNGARVIVHERDLDFVSNTTCFIKVTNGRKAWSLIESYIHDHPQKELCITGITGTNGKTSTAWYLYQYLQQNEIPSCMIGTLGIFLADEFEESPHTTPDPSKLFQVLSACKAKGIQHVVMEVSSQSLLHGKVQGLKFDQLVFTNFTQDHLDLHKTMEAYFDAKMLFFRKHAHDQSAFIIHNSVKDRFLKAFEKPLHNPLHIYDSPNGWEIKVQGGQSLQFFNKDKSEISINFRATA